jgi:hypothetical protein
MAEGAPLLTVAFVGGYCSPLFGNEQNIVIDTHFDSTSLLVSPVITYCLPLDAI